MVSPVSITITRISLLRLYSLDPVAVKQAEHGVAGFLSYVWPIRNVKIRINRIVTITADSLHELCFVDGLSDWSCKCCRAQKREQAKPASKTLEESHGNTSWVVKLFRECRVSFKMLMKMMEVVKKGDLMKIMKMIKMMKKRRSQQVFIILNLPRLASNSSLLSHPAQNFTISRLSYPHRRHGTNSL